MKAVSHEAPSGASFSVAEGGGRMRWLTVFILGLTLLVSACGRPGSGDKIAVVDLEKVLADHPRQVELQKEKQSYEALQKARDSQALFLRTQMANLRTLQAVKQSGRKNFLAADLFTRMTEEELKEQEALEKARAEASLRADRELAEESEALERQYRLRIFNLRLKLETVQMTPEEKEKVRQELDRVLAERNRDLDALEARKGELVARDIAPLVEASRKRLAAAAEEYHKGAAADISGMEKKDADTLETAPKALLDNLAKMDRQLEAEKQKLDALESGLRDDITSRVTRMAKKRGYTVVFSRYQTNVSADDLTQDVINELRQEASKAKTARALKPAGKAAPAQPAGA